MGDDDDKTEEPTGKRLSDARQDGDVPNSREVTGLISLFVSLIIVYFLFPFVTEHIQSLFRFYLTFYGREITKDMLMEFFLVTMKELGIMLLPICMSIMIAGIAGTISQIGLLFTTKPLEFDLNKLNPINGIKNLFSIQKVVETIKMTVKSGIVLGVAFWYFMDFLKEMPTVIMFTFFQQLHWLIEKIVILIGIILLIMLVFAAIDFVWVRYSYKKKLRMSKQDIKDEHKNMEGNPEIKGKIRAKQMEMVRKRMMSSVPSADVVVTNPTHYAVAIRYEEGRDKVPIVVAKGVDTLAQKIKEIAREHNIPVYENPPLARDLYKNVEIEHAVPERLWQAVAEVLAFVRTTNKKR